MTMKQMFQKVENHNEIADLLREPRTAISFQDRYYGPEIDNYKEFAKYVRDEYIKELADKILKSDGWEFDKELTLEWSGGVVRITPELL